MRLFLAVAVLVLAFVAYSEAQDQTIEDKLSKIGGHVTEFGKNLAEKAKTTIEGIHNSDFAIRTRNWLQEQLSKLKERVSQ